MRAVNIYFTKFLSRPKIPPSASNYLTAGRRGSRPANLFASCTYPIYSNLTRPSIWVTARPFWSPRAGLVNFASHFAILDIHVTPLYVGLSFVHTANLDLFGPAIGGLGHRAAIMVRLRYFPTALAVRVNLHSLQPPTITHHQHPSAHARANFALTFGRFPELHRT